MSEFTAKSPAEEVLIENRVFTRRSAAKRAAVGCIGCRFLQLEQAGDDPVLYGYQIKKCAGIPGGVLYPILNRLSEADVIAKEREEVPEEGPARPLRTYYRPSASEIGTTFYQQLELPPVCNLELEQPEEQ